MKSLQVNIDLDELEYARHVAVHGKDTSNNGRNCYVIADIKLLNELPGKVVVGCVVDTENQRIKQGEDQDFGNIKIMFYILFEKQQMECIKGMYPDTKLNYFEQGDKQAVIIGWREYKEALNINIQ